MKFTETFSTPPKLLLSHASFCFFSPLQKNVLARLAVKTTVQTRALPVYGPRGLSPSLFGPVYYLAYLLTPPPGTPLFIFRLLSPMFAMVIYLCVYVFFLNGDLFSSYFFEFYFLFRRSNKNIDHQMISDRSKTLFLQFAENPFYTDTKTSFSLFSLFIQRHFACGLRKVCTIEGVEWLFYAKSLVQFQNPAGLRA